MFKTVIVAGNLVLFAVLALVLYEAHRNNQIVSPFGTSLPKLSSSFRPTSLRSVARKLSAKLRWASPTPQTARDSTKRSEARPPI